MSVEISRFSQQFYFIGLAETNVGSDAGSVYMIPGINHFIRILTITRKKGQELPFMKMIILMQLLIKPYP